MLPREKANELIVKIMSIELEENRIPKISFNQAKQCALIVVNEVLNTILSVYQPATKQYWYIVKEEIEKI